MPSGGQSFTQSTYTADWATEFPRRCVSRDVMQYFQRSIALQRVLPETEGMKTTDGLLEARFVPNLFRGHIAGNPEKQLRGLGAGGEAQRLAPEIHKAGHQPCARTLCR